MEKISVGHNVIDVITHVKRQGNVVCLSASNLEVCLDLKNILKLNNCLNDFWLTWDIYFMPMNEIIGQSIII